MVKTCSVAGCQSEPVGRTWCSKHYARWRAHGDPLTTFRLEYASPLEALRVTGWIITAQDCWEWKGKPNKGGYGRVCYLSKSRAVHRLAYETWVGPIPDGLIVRHKCDNPPCINPEHLLLGTLGDNNGDTAARDRTKWGENQWKSVMTKEIAQGILDMYATGNFTQHALAQHHGIHKATVNDLILGKTWRRLRRTYEHD